MGAMAQSHTSYFMNRMGVRNKMNPALINDYGYVSIPAIGSISVGLNTNQGLSSFLFPGANGELLTFAHPDVSADEFMSGLRDDISVAQTLDMDILSAGFYSWGGYSTFEVSLSQDASFGTPKELFGFLKTSGNGDYDISGMNVQASSTVRVALGHARKLNDDWTLGAKVKILFGVGRADLMVDRCDVSINEDRLSVNTAGHGYATILGCPFGDVDKDGNIGFGSFNPTSVSGFGLGVDLGATYEGLAEGLTLSASLVDLGFMKWSNISPLRLKEGELVYEGFNDLDMNDPEGSMNDQLEDLGDRASDLLKFEQRGDAISMSEGLTFKAYVGAEYKMCKDMLTFGLLYSAAVYSRHDIHQLTGSVVFTPHPCVSLAVSGSVSNYGSGFGTMLSFSPNKVFNFFVGADCMPTAYSPQFIPLESVSSKINFGFSIPIGGSKSSMRTML